MTRSASFAIVALVLALALMLPAPPVDAKGNPPRLWGGDIREPIVPDLAPFLSVDPLINPPAEPGEAYWIESDWWPTAVSDLGLRDPHEDYLPGEEVARYYPAVSAVVLTVDGDEQWVRVKADLDVMLNRYIALAEAGAISAHPSALELMSAARDVLGEDVELRINGEVVPSSEAERVWEHAPAMAATYRDVFPVDLGQDGQYFTLRDPGYRIGYDYFVTFTLPEGRRFEYRYIRNHGFLINWTAGLPSYPAYEVGPEAHAVLERLASDAPLPPVSVALLGGAGVGGVLALVALVAIAAERGRLRATSSAGWRRRRSRTAP